ncbi:hypothetical protein POSPLADRAFT_1051293 [Postia placenta MAD-698-R-SB12]|uniref:Uncharacterized protein n=1 Tax=Postia placenta MAD-698-R-SB12 TaxID=670580 RepID=A0A1X6NET5_9APHY|nr:hypothetical protein POSPLADRAFT_1051293 [Postia placenta MAD-698-R-SB12]OSX67137.1 hypothetical protein POSPLADRAFT_1051293 [Postia placenta MAD-698-R-SB12]
MRTSTVLAVAAVAAPAFAAALPAPQEYVLYQRATPAGSEALSLGGLFKAAKDGYTIAKDGVDAYHAGKDAWDNLKSSSTSSETSPKKSSKKPPKKSSKKSSKKSREEDPVPEHFQAQPVDHPAFQPTHAAYPAQTHPAYAEHAGQHPAAYPSPTHIGQLGGHPSVYNHHGGFPHGEGRYGHRGGFPHREGRYDQQRHSMGAYAHRPANTPSANSLQPLAHVARTINWSGLAQAGQDAVTIGQDGYDAFEAGKDAWESLKGSKKSRRELLDILEARSILDELD